MTPEAKAAYHRAYYAAHRAERAAYDAAHRGEKAAYNRAYYAARRAEKTAYQRAYHAANRARQTAYKRARHAALKPVVYAWFAPDGSAEYVGRGTSSRADTHRRQPWWTPQHLLLSMSCDSEWQAMEYEGRWGARYQPRHNREGYRHAQGSPEPELIRA